MKHSILLLSVILMLLQGCSQKNKAVKSISLNNPPKYKLAPIPKRSVQQKGSLYASGGSSLFSDKKDLQIGDIVKVVIQETLINSTSDTVKTTKANSSSAKGGLITPVANTPARLGKFIGKANGILGIGFSGGSNNSFSGTSAGSNTDKFQANISAIVQRKYQNGNYFIVGTKTMLINGQKQMVQISGMIRPYDINPVNNSVKSDEIANLKISYSKKGAFTNEIEKPWGTKALEKIAPF